MKTWTEEQAETLAAFVETLLERVADGRDDVETAKVDVMSIITASDDAERRKMVFASETQLAAWRTHSEA